MDLRTVIVFCFLSSWPGCTGHWVALVFPGFFEAPTERHQCDSSSQTQPKTGRGPYQHLSRLEQKDVQSCPSNLGATFDRCFWWTISKYLRTLRLGVKFQLLFLVVKGHKFHIGGFTDSGGCLIGEATRMLLARSCLWFWISCNTCFIRNANEDTCIVKCYVFGVDVPKNGPI